MGLDLIISTNKKIEHRTTGIYIREGGMNKELKTIDEVRKHFPGYDISHIKEYTYFDDIFWNMHITHNMCEMASHIVVNDISLYLLLWRPKELGFIYVNEDYIDYVNKCLEILIKEKEELLKYNPPNGWGSYETLLGFVSSLSESFKAMKLNKYKYTIISSV